MVGLSRPDGLGADAIVYIGIENARPAARSHPVQSVRRRLPGPHPLARTAAQAARDTDRGRLAARFRTLGAESLVLASGTRDWYSLAVKFGVLFIPTGWRAAVIVSPCSVSHPADRGADFRRRRGAASANATNINRKEAKHEL